MLAVQISITIEIIVNFITNKIFAYFSYLQVDFQYYYIRYFSL